jgi:hypothetical protein|tara:strand:+ start:2966 stop:3424 length:459 start_codon:yes stop_codon:yes gene_type:complete
MNITLWRKYVITFVSRSSSRWTDLNDQTIYWVNIEKKVRKYSDEEKRHCNHPDVRNHLGFWKNDTTLVMGYRLKENSEIIRPIWSYKREKLHKKFLNQFQKKYPRKIKKILHGYLSKYLILKQLPPEIVNIIIHFLTFHKKRTKKIEDKFID